MGWVLGRSFGQDGPLRAEPVKSKLTRWAIGLDGQFRNLDFTSSATWSSSSRKITKADTMSYRDKRALQGLGGIDCEQEVPNQYVDGMLQFDLETLQQHAGKGNCMYWSPFSNGMYGAHPQVPGAEYYENPDFNPSLDNRRLFDYLLTERIIRGKTSLLVLEGIVSGVLPFQFLGNDIDFALGAQWRRETFKMGPIPGASNDGNVNPCPAGNCNAGDPHYRERIRFGKATSLADLQAIEVNIVNGPDIETDGIDFSGRYRFPAGPGSMEFKLSGTRILSYDIDSWELGVSYDALGHLNYETPLARTLTEWKILWHANYAWSDFNLRYAAKFVNSYDNVEDDIKIDSNLTHDLHFHWTVKGGKLNVWATLLNLTDKDPPFAGEDLNYDAFTHNPLGRIFKFGFTYVF